MGNGQRAPRRSEAEWETWRHELVRLFVEENVSRKEIIHIMADKNRFYITDKQLKHRFEKWDVKRNINDDDMTTMLALKRKFQATGKDIHFQYKGHNVEEEKLERAGKRRRRELASPTFIQPYIKVYTSSSQSPQPASQAFLRGYGPPQVLERQFNSHFNSQDIQASFPMHWTNDGPDPSQGVYTRNTNEPRFVEVAQTSQDELMTDATLVPVGSYSGQGMVEGGFNPNGYGHLRTEATSNPYLNHTPNDVVMSPPSPNGSTVSSGIWASWMNLSPSPAQSENPVDERSSTRLSLPRNMIPSPTTDVMPILGDVENEGGSLSTQVHVQLGNGQPITCDNFDPSSALLPLLLMKKQLEEDLSYEFPSAISRRGLGLAKLLDKLQSEWLRLEIGKIACWGAERYSQSERERQARTQTRSLHSNFEKSHELSKHRRRSGDKSEAEDELNIFYQGCAESRSGRLRVLRGTILNQKAYANILKVLEVYFVPDECERTIGLSVTFLSIMNEVRGPRISPRLKTFNVIPYDSEIAKCIYNHDLHGVQTLFDKREASPTDVTKGGNSILNCAIECQAIDIIELLLEGGADTQMFHCDGAPSNMLFAVWCSVQSPVDEDPDLAIRRINGCKRMSDAALRYGFDIDKSTTWNCRDSNPLFALVAETASGLPPHAMMDALRYLCNIGYDIGQRDSEGLTLLLFEASLVCPSVIGVLKFLIEKGADLGTADTHNRGALHYALRPPPGCGAWGSSCTDECDHILFEHVEWAKVIVCETDGGQYTEDYCDDGLTPAPSFIDEDDEDDEDYEDYENDDENDTEALEIPDGYVRYYEWGTGRGYIIPDPLPVLKTRLRFKLLTLLRAGCDPNVLDDKGNSPSDYARSQRLWPEWTWALQNSGYDFDEDSNCCVRRSDNDVS